MKLFFSLLNSVSGQPNEIKQKWNEAFTASNEICTASGYICMHHFKKEDFMSQGKGISRLCLKKTAVPSIFGQKDDAELEADVDCGASQSVDILLETELDSLERLLDEEKKKNRILVQEINQKDCVIQNQANELMKFKKNDLAQFAVRAHQNFEVI